MLAALAARRLGLDTYLQFYGDSGPSVGNRMLAELAGAEIAFTGSPDRLSVDEAIDTTAVKLRSAGRRPYVLPRGGATARGAVGYVRATLELHEQLLQVRVAPVQLWVATGSCATQAGLVAGARWLGCPYDVIGVTVSRTVTECEQRVLELASGAAGLVGAARPEAADVIVRGGSIGPGYGLRSAEGDAAAALVARTESVFLDPVFGAKAMSALLSDPPAAGPVVFLVSGGAPTLFSIGPVAGAGMPG
jgi:D-cysteine desulfhydrase